MFGIEFKSAPPEAADIAAALEQVFEREAQALRKADFEGLEDLLAEKERLSEALSAVAPPLDPDRARRLQAQAVRNAGLLDAVRAGLRAGADRIEALAAPAAPLQTYDGHGRRTELPQGPVRPGRRA